MCELSIVIIAKNEEENIQKCLESIEEIKKNYNCQIILVDSCSFDLTVEKAAVYNPDIICKIEKSDLLTAALGRSLGQDLSQGEYIFFIDGDMEVNKESFIKCFEILKKSDDDIAGITGERIDIYHNLNSKSKRINNLKIGKTRKIREFGGAVIFKNHIIKKIGSYNPRIISNEEGELYVRLLKLRKKVIGIPDNFIYHHTKYNSTFKKLVNMMFGRSNLGFGQSLKSSIDNGAFLWFFIKYYPFFIGLIMDILSIYILFKGLWVFIFLIQLGLIILNYLTHEGRLHFYLVNKFRIIFILPGIFNYKKKIICKFRILPLNEIKIVIFQ